MDFPTWVLHKSDWLLIPIEDLCRENNSGIHQFRGGILYRKKRNLFQIPIFRRRNPLTDSWEEETGIGYVRLYTKSNLRPGDPKIRLCLAKEGLLDLLTHIFYGPK